MCGIFIDAASDTTLDTIYLVRLYWVSFRWSSGYDFRLTLSFRERSPVRPRAETFLTAGTHDLVG